MTTRTWMTTPVGSAPAGDAASEERWVPGPAVPSEPRPPSRFRGLVAQVVVLLAVVGLTFLVGEQISSNRQDPGVDDTGTIDAGSQVDA